MTRLPLSRGLFALVDDADAVWLSRWKWSAIGRPGGYYAKRNDYSAGRRHPVSIAMHRLIVGATPGVEVDHVNGDTLDNRRANLRVCSHGENARNIPAYRGRSRYKGVTWAAHLEKWRARIQVSGTTHALGCFDSEEEAARAYDEAARRLHGAFARLNLTHAA